jgi:ABC-type uncharacterized transport system involved in gliding motility auxiliary subunit
MKDGITLNPMFLQPPSSGTEEKSYLLSCMIQGEFPSYFDGKPIPEKPADDSKTDKKPDESAASGKGDSDTTKNSETSVKPSESQMIKEQGAFISKGKPAKIILVASAEMLKDTMLDAEGQSPNATFVQNSIDAANGRDGIAQMRSKKQSFNPLNQTTPAVKMTVKTLNIAGVPALVICFGLLVWLKRKSRKKHIQMMFEK